MATPTTGSPYVTSLDSRIYADMCAGYFYIDTSPTVYIGTGYLNVQGASVKITNPVGVVIDNYITSGFDIYPPMTSVYSFAIPLIAGNFTYGTYTIDVRLTDADGDTYVISKSVNLCPPDPDNITRKYGCIDMSIKGNCRTGEAVFLLNNPPNYKGTTFSSTVNALTVKYPTASGKTDLTTTLGSFSLQLYEGQYQVSGTVCALYLYGDSVYFKVNYKVKCEKTIKCIIDECCVFEKLEELNLQIQSDCTQAQKDATSSKIFQALYLLKTADLAGNCGGDPSDYITQLEGVLGCTCTCNCNEGTPVIGNSSNDGDSVYRGLLTQTGTGIPTDVPEIFNRVTLAFTRNIAGGYTATLSGTFTPLTANNTFLVTGSGLAAGDKIDAFYSSANTIDIKTQNSAGVAADNVLFNTALQIVILNQ